MKKIFNWLRSLFKQRNGEPAQSAPPTLIEELMQIRVHGRWEHGKTGYGVTAFIPEEVLAVMRGKQEKDQALFVEVVAKVLVDRAIKGLYYRNQHGKAAAMIFEPVGSPKAGLVHNICMVDEKPRMLKPAPVGLPLPPKNPVEKLWT